MNKDNIYEIYRACRLCGVGAGYKMPIVQSIIYIDEEEVELRHKIKECLQLEVSLEDRMPPLICELCVDKVHDFYEFRKMCQETNRRTRMKLGLPLQTVKSMPEPESKLGVTVQINVDSDEGEPLVKSQASRKPRPKSTKTRKEPELKVENEPIMVLESRSPSPEIGKRETRRKRASSPKRPTRQNRTDDVPLSELQDVSTPKPQPQPQPRSRSRAAPKSVLSSRERLTEAVQRMADEEEDHSLLVLRHKRPREVAMETPPGSKKPKLSEPVKPEKTPRPGPKSSKEPPKPTPPQTPPPKAGPKSKKSLPEEESLKYKNTILIGKSKPEDVKSKSKVETPQPAPKSTKMAETAPGAMSRTKKRNASPPAPKSKKTREASPAVSEKASEASRASPAQKAPFIECTICGVKVKGIKGLPGHMKTHVVTYTPPKLACNACELWFPSNELASSHHRRHSAAALPYTCNKCYDDFKTDADYELHFTRNQCLPTYEVPDVKCDECWKMFATYKLLEDHRCLGEGGRPGGKCPNCKRTYATLKSLTMHELRCTVKKKAEPQTEIEETPKVEDKPLEDNATVKVEDNSRGMLPMKVRIVRCDLLLSADRGRYDVQGLSQKFGLDRNCTYPYLLTVKSKPSTSGHMVSINDDIKQEYMNEDDTAHWDSDDSDDNKSISNKSVDSLSNISLKTIFSQKCLGKVSKNKRKVKSDADTETALDNDDRDSAKSRFDHLIKESNSDYDSDSILDRNVERKADSADLFDSVKSLAVSNALDASKDMNKDKISDRNVGDTTSSNIDELDNIELDKMVTNDSNDRSTDSSQNDTEIDAYKKSNAVANSQATLDEDIQSESKICKEDSSETADDVSQNENSQNSTKNGHLVSNKTINEESISTSEQAENGKAQSEIANMDVDQIGSRDNDDASNLVDSSNLESESRSNDDSNISNLVDSSDLEIKETTANKMTENSKDADRKELVPKSPEVNRNIDNVETSLSHESNKLHESADSFVANGETNENDKFGTDDGSSCTKNDKKDKTESSDVPFANDDQSHKNTDTSFEKNDKVDNNDLSEINDDGLNNSRATKILQKDLELIYSKDDTNQNEEAEQNLIDSKESLITENELFETEKVQSADKFDMNYLDEEDKLLMAELDAQIGENEPENKDVTGENRNEGSENTSQGRENRSEASENTNQGRENRNEGVENRSHGGENRYEGGENSVIGENSAVASASDVIAENNDKKCNSQVNNSDEKNDAFAALMEQNDLKSLDLDSISDEEYNFDI